jgi:hypothetical protein
MSAADNVLELNGTYFHIPTSCIGVNRDERLAVAFFSSSAVLFGRDIVEHDFTPGAVDLGFVRKGRAPLLTEHMRCLDALIGQVLTAEIIDGCIMRCLCRFARGKEADRLWNMVCSGFPLSISCGARIKHAVKVADVDQFTAHYRVTQWELRELSVCCFGKDEDAFIRQLGQDDDAAEMVARFSERDAGQDPARAEVRRILHLDRWNEWTIPAGVRIAQTIEADPVAVCAALKTEVVGHCADLERDFAL